MSTLLQARQELSQTIEKIEGMLHLQLKESRALSTDEEKELSTLEEEQQRLEKLIERLERNAQAKQRQDESGDVAVSIRVTREEHEDENGVYKPFRSLGEQLQAVRSAAMPGGTVHSGLIGIAKRAASGMSEGIGADGGFLVQTDYATELMRAAFETGVLASRVRRFPLSANSNRLVLNAVDEKSRVDGSRWGGVQVYWENEGDAATASKPKFKRMEFNLQKLIGLCYATDELLQDAAALGSVISQAFEEEFGFKIDSAIFAGDGAGKPQGLLDATSTVTVSKEGSQAADTINALNVMKMRARLWSRSRQNAVWLINQDCEPQLHKLNFTGDGSKSDIPVYVPARGLADQPYDTLYGRPIIPIEQAKTLGDKGDIMFVDLSQYGMIDRNGLEQATSIHVKFTTDETAFRFVARLDGKPLWLNALTPANGSNTLSPCVVLQAR